MGSNQTARASLTLPHCALSCIYLWRLSRPGLPGSQANPSLRRPPSCRGVPRGQALLSLQENLASQAAPGVLEKRKHEFLGRGCKGQHVPGSVPLPSTRGAHSRRL